MSSMGKRGKSQLHSGLNRMAAISRRHMSFGSAVAIGLAAGNLAERSGTVRYNGAGFAGDQRAVASDFSSSMRRAGSLIKPRG